jgi:O-Antigen ligase.
MLLELPLAVRVLLLLIVMLLTVWVAARGLQNGILLLLVTTLWLTRDFLTLFPGYLGLPGFSLDRVVWPLILLAFVWQWKHGHIHRYPPNGIEYSMLLLLVVVVSNMFAHGTHIGNEWGAEGNLHFSTVLSGFFLPSVSFFIMRRVILRKAQAHTFVTGIGIITLYLGITGCAEVFHLNWLVFPPYILDPTVGIHFGHVRGPFVSATMNGVAIALGLPILLWLTLGTHNSFRWVGLLGIITVCVSLPYVIQRAVWLGAAMACAIAIVAWPGQRLISVVALVLLISVSILIVPQSLLAMIQGKLDDQGTIEYRARIANESVAIIRENLVTGIGLYRFNPVLHKRLGTAYNSHNTPLALLAELGLLGFLPYMTIFILCFWYSVKAYWHQPESRALIAGLWGITSAYAIGLGAVEMIGALYVNTLFFALWGMVLGMTQQRWPKSGHRVAANP